MSLRRMLQHQQQKMDIGELIGEAPALIEKIKAAVKFFTENDNSGVEQILREVFQEGFEQIDQALDSIQENINESPNLGALEGEEKEEWDSLTEESQAVILERQAEVLAALEEQKATLLEKKGELEGLLQNMVQAAVGAKDIVSDILEFVITLRAKGTRKYYNALINQGFSTEQAFQIIISTNDLAGLPQALKDLAKKLSS